MITVWTLKFFYLATTLNLTGAQTYDDTYEIANAQIIRVDCDMIEMDIDACGECESVAITIQFEATDEWVALIYDSAFRRCLRYGVHIYRNDILFRFGFVPLSGVKYDEKNGLITITVYDLLYFMSKSKTEERYVIDATSDVVIHDELVSATGAYMINGLALAVPELPRAIGNSFVDNSQALPTMPVNATAEFVVDEDNPGSIEHTYRIYSSVVYYSIVGRVLLFVMHIRAWSVYDDVGGYTYYIMTHGQIWRLGIDNYTMFENTQMYDYTRTETYTGNIETKIDQILARVYTLNDGSFIVGWPDGWYDTATASEVHYQLQYTALYNDIDDPDRQTGLRTTATATGYSELVTARYEINMDDDVGHISQASTQFKAFCLLRGVAVSVNEYGQIVFTPALWDTMQGTVYEIDDADVESAEITFAERDEIDYSPLYTILGEDEAELLLQALRPYYAGRTIGKLSIQLDVCGIAPVLRDIISYHGRNYMVDGVRQTQNGHTVRVRGRLVE